MFDLYGDICYVSTDEGMARWTVDKCSVIKDDPVM